MTPNEMLRILTEIWLNLAKKHPEADLERVMELVQELQLIIFVLEESDLMSEGDGYRERDNW